MVTVTNPRNSPPKAKRTRRSYKKRKTTLTPSAEQGDVDNSAMDDLPTDTTNRGTSQLEIQAGNVDREGDDDDVVMIDPSAPAATTSHPVFPPLPASAHAHKTKSETRRILIPPHRMTPLQKDWINIFSPLTEMCGLQVRMNVLRKCVEMRVCLSHFCHSFGS